MVLCDVPEYCTIIDQSGWPVGKPLCMKTKNDFITYILDEELLGKRMQLLQNFREGLDHFGLVKLMQAKPDLWESFFVTNNQSKLDADTLISLVDPTLNLGDDEAKAFAFFIDFIKDHAFCTGNLSSISFFIK